MPSKTPCPRPSLIREFAEERLTSAASDAVAAHVEECVSCAELVAQSKASVSSNEPLSSSPPTATGKQKAHGLPKGAAVGRYLVLDRLSAAGAGVVYAAYDPDLHRRVALKLLKARMEAGSDWQNAQHRLLIE